MTTSPLPNGPLPPLSSTIQSMNGKAVLRDGLQVVVAASLVVAAIGVFFFTTLSAGEFSQVPQARLDQMIQNSSYITLGACGVASVACLALFVFKPSHNEESEHADSEKATDWNQLVKLMRKTVRQEGGSTRPGWIKF